MHKSCDFFFRQALKFKPDYHQAWYNRGNALDNLGRNEAAIASYDQALKFKPDYHQAWYNKASSYQGYFVLDRNRPRAKTAISPKNC